MHLYFKERRKAAKLTSERDAVRTLTAYAKYETGARCEVHLRSAMVGGALLLDFCDETGRCIEITPMGWRVLPTAPVKFQRVPGMAALPLPERGGDIKQLRQFGPTSATPTSFCLSPCSPMRCVRVDRMFCSIWSAKAAQGRRQRPGLRAA